MPNQPDKTRCHIRLPEIYWRVIDDICVQQDRGRSSFFKLMLDQMLRVELAEAQAAARKGKK